MRQKIALLVFLFAVFTPSFVFAQPKKGLSGREPLLPPIFMYHEVMTTDPESNFTRRMISISPEHLEEQFKYLFDNNYKTLFVSEFIKLRTQGKKVPKKSVVLTFDDGTQDVSNVVFGLLKKYQIKITIFVNPGFNGTNSRMTFDQIRELSESGLVEVGAHTMKHLNLQEISDDEARSEIINSKNTVEKITGKKVVSFAYPFGKFGYREEKMVAETGIGVACGADKSHGRNYRNLLALPRTMIGEHTSLKSFVRALHGW